MTDAVHYGMTVKQLDSLHSAHLERMENFRRDKESLTPNSIPEAVIQLRELYDKHFDLSPKGINCGSCADFATDLIEIVGRGEVCWWDEMDPTEDELAGITKYETYLPSHAFARIDGKIYDSQSPEGVDDWRDLHIYAG